MNRIRHSDRRGPKWLFRDILHEIARRIRNVILALKGHDFDL